MSPSAISTTTSALSGSTITINQSLSLNQNLNQNLWQTALNSLPPDIQSNFVIAKTHKRDVLAAVLQAAEDKRQLCLRKRWKFKKPNGDEVILRDVVEKITRWIHVFKAVGDTSVQFDTTGASLPWAAVRFLLQTTVNDVQLMGAMMIDLEIISRLIARYREFENAHLLSQASPKTPVESMLREALTCLYAEVLVHLASIVSYFSESTIVRLAKSTFRLADNEQMQKIHIREAELLKLAQLSDTQVLHLLQTALVRLTDQASLSAKVLDEEKYTQLLKWLSVSPFSRHHQLRSETRIQGTGSWLLNRPEYQDWAISSTSSILMLHGIPGSGKSTLCSVVIESLLATASSQPLVAPFAYFYCADSEFEPERASPDEILRSLLRQLAIDIKGNLMVRDLLWSTYERRAAEARVNGIDLAKLRAKDCLDLLLSLAAEDPLTIVIDAVDEIKPSGRHTLLSALNRLVAEGDNVVKVFVTSRNENQIFHLLPDSRKINITAQDTQSDIESFVQHLVSEAVTEKRLLNGTASPELCATLQDTLSTRAGEMFLWAKLQMDHLCRKKHQDDIFNALTTSDLMLNKVDELYQHALDQILEADRFARDVAIGTFSWLLYMKEPLGPGALVTAITAVDPANPTDTSTIKLDPSQLPEFCFNLIILDTKCNVVRFAHQSVQDFLRTKENLLDPTSAHQTLAKSCLEICSRGPPPEYKPPSPGSSLSFDSFAFDVFYPYAVAYWATHYRSADPKQEEGKVLFKQVESFVFDEDMDVSLSFDVWLESAQELAGMLPDGHNMRPTLDATYSDEGTPLFVAAIFGLVHLVELLAQNSTTIEDWNQRNHQGHTAIYLAAVNGHAAVVELLLKLEANPNIECGRHGNSLHAACFSGHKDVVKLLLEHNPPPSSIHTGTKFKNALEAAFRGGNEDIVTLILSQTSSFAIQSQEDYEQAVQGAALAGFLQVLDHLQTNQTYGSYQRETNNTQDKIKAKTSKAIRGGQLGVLRKFLQKDPNPTRLLPENAIALATLHGHEDLVAYLLSLDNPKMDIEAPGPLGTPLRTASLLNHSRIACLLLDHSASPDGNTTTTTAQSNLGTPLQAASQKGHLRIVRLLLDAGAQPNTDTGTTYGTALQAAAYHGHKEVVAALLDGGADVYTKGLSEDAFHAAAEGGHYEIVTYLLGRGYEFRNRPRFMASMAPSPASRHLLRDGSPSRVAVAGRGDYDDERRWGRRRTGRKGEGEEEELVAVFESLGLEEEDTVVPYERENHWRMDKTYRPDYYALEVSAAVGDTRTVETLLGKRVALGIEDGDVDDALRAAVKRGRLEVVRVLLEHLVERGGGVVDGAQLEGAMRLSCEYGEGGVTEYIFGFAVQHGCSEEVVDRLRGIMNALALFEEKYTARGGVTKKEVFKDFDEACSEGDGQRTSIILASEGGFGHLSSSDNRLSNGFRVAALRGLTELIRLLLDHPDLSHDVLRATEAFQWASGLGNAQAVSTMLPYLEGRDDFPGLLASALAIAAENGHPETVRILLGHKEADPNAITTVIPAPNTLPAIPRPSDGEGSEGDSSDGKSAVHRPPPPWPGIREKESSDGKQKMSILQRALGGFRRFDMDRKSNYSTSDWFNSSEEGQEAVVCLLLDHGADPNALGGDSQDEFPIQVAARYAPVSVVRKLIAAGADVNAVGNTGAVGSESALGIAVGREAEAVLFVRDLVEAGAVLPPSDEVEEVMRLLKKPLGYFVSRLERGRSYFNADGFFRESNSPQELFEDGPAAVVELLLHHYPEFRPQDCDKYSLLLQKAAFLGRRDYVAMLIDRGFDVNATGHYYGTALQAAARCGRVDTVTDLLRAGAKVNIIHGKHGTPFRAAVVAANLETVKLLLENGADVHLGVSRDPMHPPWDKTGLPILQLAAGCNASAEIVKLLLSYGVRANAEHIYMNRNKIETPYPITSYCAAGNADAVQVLLDAGVPVNIPGKVALPSEHANRSWLYRSTGWIQDISPLHTACLAGHVEVVRLLLAKGADVHKKRDDVSGTPLMVASKNGHLRIVEMLLGAGAQVNSGTPRRTPLSEAAGNGHDELVRVLLDAGAKVSSNDPPLRNALSAACRGWEPGSQGADRVLELLLESVMGANDDEGDYNPEEVIDSAGISLIKRLDREGYPQRFESAFLRFLEYVPLDAAKYLFAAANVGSPTAVRMFLDRGMDPNGGGGEISRIGSPLQVACKKLRVDVVRLLLERGADPEGGVHARLGAPVEDGLEVRTSTPLVLALERCAAPGWEGLDIGKGGEAESESSGGDGSDEESRGGDTGEVEGEDNDDEDRNGGKDDSTVKEAEEDASSDEDAGAHESDDSESEGDTESSSEESEDSDEWSDAHSESSLAHRSSYKKPGINGQDVANCEEIVRLLFNHGAKDISTSSGGYGTPLHLACFIGSAAIVRSLLSKGADVNTNVDEPFETPLFAALEGRHPSTILPILIGHGADVAYRHGKFGTPLYHACKKNCITSVRSLLEHGADPLSVANDEGETALDFLFKKKDGIPSLWDNQEQTRYTILSIILQHVKKTGSFRVTDRHEDLAAATDTYCSENFIKILLDLDPSYVPSEKALLTVLKAWDFLHTHSKLPVLRAVMERNPDLCITEPMLMTRPSAKIIGHLLGTGRSVCEITTEILEAQQDPGTIELLLERAGDGVVVSEKVVLVVLGDSKFRRNGDRWVGLLGKIWERNPGLEVTEGMLKAAQESANMEFLLGRYGGTVSLGVVESTCRHGGYSDRLDLLRVVLGRYYGDGRGGEEVRRIESGMITRMLGWGGNGTGGVVELLGGFLEYDTELEITEGIFLAILKHGGYRDVKVDSERLDGFAGLLKRFGKTVVFTDKMRMALEEVCQGDLAEWKGWYLGLDPVRG